MKGTINMEFNGSKTKIAVNVMDIGTADKCAIIDNLLDALNCKGSEKMSILTAVAVAALTDKDKEENKDESRCFGNKNV